MALVATGADILPESNGHPTVEHRLVLRVQGTELTLNVGEARQLREALTEALPTP